MEVSQQLMYLQPTHCQASIDPTRKRKILDPTDQNIRAPKVRCIDHALVNGRIDQPQPSSSSCCPSYQYNLITSSANHLPLPVTSSLSSTSISSSFNPSSSGNHEVMEYTQYSHFTPPAQTNHIPSVITCPQCLAGESGHLMHIIQQQ